MAGEVAAGNLVTGAIKNSHVNSAASIDKAKLAVRALTSIPLNLLDLRKWDALEQLMPVTPTSTYLGLITGTYGSGPPQAQTGDLKTTTTTRRARMIVTLPDTYDTGGGVQIRCFAGMKTTVADTSCTILVEAYLLYDDGTVSANLVSTAATTINSLTYASKDFVLDPTLLTPGARLDVRVSIVVTDAASGTAVIGLLQSLVLRCDLRP